jgi:hypothetical protein
MGWVRPERELLPIAHVDKGGPTPRDFSVLGPSLTGLDAAIGQLR